MLNHLSISNYVLIRELDMDFPSGLNIITGETGAGKSIMLGALSLLLGKKADTSVFSDNTRNCVIEGEFELNGGPVILRRVITPTGRSRAFLDDEPVSVGTLSELSARLVDIHEQHQSGLLSDPEYQLEIIDGYCGNENLLSEYQDVWKRLQEKKGELASLKESVAAAERDRDYRQFQYDQLESASLTEGELEELDAEQKMLSNAETIKGELVRSSGSLDNEDYSVVRSMKDAASSLSRAEKYIPEVKELSRRLTEARIEVEDICSEIERMTEKINVSPGRLMEVEERLDALYSLMKKHNVPSIAGLIGIRDELGTLLSKAESDGQTVLMTESEIAALESELAGRAAELSERRSRGALSFAENLQTNIRTLEMPQAIFRIAVSRRQNPGPAGFDEVKFLFSANGDREPGDLSKVASGGELSRVMLSLKKVVSEYTSLPTMIFDEIDTGVSGRMADRMGKMIAGMGDKMQIFAITHLPQIASQKGAHFLIEKTAEDQGARTSIRRLSEQERVEEVARMLSGDTLTGAAMENARALLKENRNNSLKKQ